MLKLAVFGAQCILGRELVEVLESRDCSVLPLATGPTTAQDEEGDQIIFAPVPELMEGLDLVIVADPPKDEGMLGAFPGKILDLRGGDEAVGEPMPLSGPWPKDVARIKARPAIEQALALVPSLVSGAAGISGVYLRSVALLGDAGIQGLAAQSRDMLEGLEPDETLLGFRAAFDAIPRQPRGNLVEVLMPTFHGDILILNLGGEPKKKEGINHVKWLPQPPTSREAAVTNDVLAHYAAAPDGNSAVMILGFDPILWGVIRPVLRLLEL